jgi:hypothetical protein
MPMVDIFIKSIHTKIKTEDTKNINAPKISRKRIIKMTDEEKEERLQRRKEIRRKNNLKYQQSNKYKEYKRELYKRIKLFNKIKEHDENNIINKKMSFDEMKKTFIDNYGIRLYNKCIN